MTHNLLTRSLLLFLVTTSLVLSLQTSYENLETGSIDNEIERKQFPRKLDYNRGRRGIFFNRKKPGFFKTLFSVIFEQWNDTKNTYGYVTKQINNNFLDENAPPTPAPIMNDSNATTTAAPYKISRKEFNKIINRNLKGIVRLFRLELKDALKASDISDREFRKNASIEVSKFL